MLGHTRCGAIEAAFDAFKPGGSGTVGLPPSLAALLYEIKPAVDFILGHCKMANVEDTKDAILVVNAIYSHLKIKQMAAKTGTGHGPSVYYGIYDVNDFYLRVTNLPGYPNQKYRDAVAGRVGTSSSSMSRQATGAATPQVPSRKTRSSSQSVTSDDPGGVGRAQCQDAACEWAAQRLESCADIESLDPAKSIGGPAIDGFRSPCDRETTRPVLSSPRALAATRATLLEDVSRTR